jgi:uncharacterized membrane protein YbhN (UPF0104 family)
MVRLPSPCESRRVQLSRTISLRTLASGIAPTGAAVGTPPAQRGLLASVLPLAAGILLAALLALHAHEFLHAVVRALHAGWRVLIAGALFEAASIAGYVFLLHRVVGRACARLRFKDSYDIALAGNVAARLLPTAGLGGAAVTVWALRARGVRSRELTERLLAFLLLLYGVYMAALLLAAGGVALGIVTVVHGRALAIVGILLTVALAGGVLCVLALPSLPARLLSVAANRLPRFESAARRAERQLPVLRGALERAWRELRRPHPAVLGAVAWWGFDIAVLVAMLHAFGGSLPVVAVVLAYFLGTMFNVVPLPGSLSGGLIGVLVALGAPAAPAIAAVLAYRSVAVWLPAACGIASLARLRTSVASWRAELSPA